MTGVVDHKKFYAPEPLISLEELRESSIAYNELQTLLSGVLTKQQILLISTSKKELVNHI